MRIQATLVVVLLLWTGAAFAVPITFQHSGTVTHVDGVGFAVNVGDLFTGSFTFDSEAVDIQGSDTRGEYVSENAPFGWTAQVGSLTITDTRVDIVIDDNDAAEDLYRVTARAPMLNATFPGVDSVIMVINLRDPDGDVFTSDALPLTPPNLALFSGTKRIYLAGFPEGGGSSLFDVMATVTTLVPEPSSALLLGGGLIALASGRRAVRQRR